jgi:hypothetical protein
VLHYDRKGRHRHRQHFGGVSKWRGVQDEYVSTVQADITDINANYHSLQTSLEKRMAHGVTILANYPPSKGLDDLPFGEGASGFDNGYSALPLSNRHRFDYGPSDFDHTHVFTASYVWQTPSLKGAGHWFVISWVTTSSAGLFPPRVDGQSPFCRARKFPEPASAMTGVLLYPA